MEWRIVVIVSDNMHVHFVSLGIDAKSARSKFVTF